MSIRKGSNAVALYTADSSLLENDQVLIRAITKGADALVVEDADHLLKPRAEGNRELHRLLAFADGVALAHGRKMIFSTNLPNLGDLDDALLRPGRCFDRVFLDRMTKLQARTMMKALAEKNRYAVDFALTALETVKESHISLASIYRLQSSALRLGALPAALQPEFAHE